MKRAALVLTFVSTVLIAAAYAAAFTPGGPPGWAAWLLAMGTSGIMVGLMAVGASRNGTVPLALRVTFAGILLLLAGCFSAALALPPEAAGAALWGGLPRRAAILLYGIGVVPLFILPFAYALTFDRVTLSEADLARVRSEAARLRAEMGVGA